MKRIFPNKAVVGRTLPKEAFYKKLKLSSEIKEKFVTDIKKIIVEYKLTHETINVGKDDKTSEILVLSIELKKQDIDYRIIENIARQNTHKLLFILKFQNSIQLCVYYNKLYKTTWKPSEDINLSVKGLNLTRIWESIIEQIAVQQELIAEQDGLSVEDKLKKQEKILKLQKEIGKLERATRNEGQPKKKFELYSQLQSLKRIISEEKGE